MSLGESQPLVDQIIDVVLHTEKRLGLELTGKELMHFALETYTKIMGEFAKNNKPVQTVKIEWPGVRP